MCMRRKEIIVIQKVNVNIHHHSGMAVDHEVSKQFTES